MHVLIPRMLAWLKVNKNNHMVGKLYTLYHVQMCAPFYYLLHMGSRVQSKLPHGTHRLEHVCYKGVDGRVAVGRASEPVQTHAKV